MRKETKEIIRKEYEEVYIAEDGTVFSSEEECKKYDQTARCVIDGAFSKIKVNEIESAGISVPHIDLEEDMFCVEIKDEYDLNSVNMWIAFHKVDKSYNIRKDETHTIPLGIEAIGTKQIFSNCYGDLYWWGSVDGVKEHFRRRYEEFFDALVTLPNNEEEKSKC